MKYFQVNPSSDNVRKPNGNDILVGKELITESECNRQGFSKEFINKHCTPIEIPKNSVYWLFGARFCRSISELPEATKSKIFAASFC